MYLQDALVYSEVKIAVHVDNNGVKTVIQLGSKDGFSILTRPDSDYPNREYTMGACLWLSDNWTPIRI